MFKVLFAATVLLAPSAFAEEFNAEKASAAWYEAHAACRGLGEPGSPSPEDACRDRAILAQVLMTHDYCWNDPEQEWIKCRPKP